MRAYLEVWTDRGPEVVPLESDRTSIGRAAGSDVELADPEVSHLHAVVERYGNAWSVRDVGSSNGTYVNGDRVLAELRLQPGDEIRLGSSRLVFRAPGAAAVSDTVRADGPPKLTPREHELLVALCRPLVRGQAFAQPASVPELAAALSVSEAAVRFHLSNLYDKFAVYEAPGGRRVRLANEAVKRRAVTMGDLSSSG